jgi:hypothetical protein
MSKSEQSLTEQSMERYFFRASAKDFEALPGAPLAYWAPPALFKVFYKSKSFDDFLEWRKRITASSSTPMVCRY